jgi:hypothetical protein
MSFIGDAIGSLTGAKQSSKAAVQAAQIQSQSADKAIAAQQEAQAQTRALEQPYVDAGTGALTQYLNLLGLNGSGAQTSALGTVQSSPLLANLNQQGEDAILANASATGGLRGGNTQDALAKLRSANYSTVVQQLMSNLGGVTSLGQNAATGTGNAGIQSANSISNLLTAQGNAQAAGTQAAGNATANGFNQLLQIGGIAAGLGAFGGGSKNAYGIAGVGNIF